MYSILALCLIGTTGPLSGIRLPARLPEGGRFDLLGRPGREAW